MTCTVCPHENASEMIFFCTKDEMVSESNFRWRLVHDFGNLEATLLCSTEELHGSSHIRKEWGLLLLRSSSILSSYYYTRHLWKIWKSTYDFFCLLKGLYQRTLILVLNLSFLVYILAHCWNMAILKWLICNYF